MHKSSWNNYHCGTVNYHVNLLILDKDGLPRIHTGRVVGQMTAQIGPYNLLWCQQIC